MGKRVCAASRMAEESTRDGEPRKHALIQSQVRVSRLCLLYSRLQAGY
jgi:hypothetical protein